MRIPVFARRANPLVDRPILRKSESYGADQVAAGLADWVDPQDRRKGIIARQYLPSARVIVQEETESPNFFTLSGELRGVKFIPPARSTIMGIVPTMKAAWDWTADQISA